MQLPPYTAVYVILDGISYYENEDWRDEMCDIVRSLQELTSSSASRSSGGSSHQQESDWLGGYGVSTMFKLLLTSANKSTVVSKQIQNQVALRAGQTSYGPVVDHASLEGMIQQNQNTSALPHGDRHPSLLQSPINAPDTASMRRIYLGNAEPGFRHWNGEQAPQYTENPRSHKPPHYNTPARFEPREDYVGTASIHQGLGKGNNRLIIRGIGKEPF